MANRLHQLMPNFARHEGRWIGTYTQKTPAGETIDSYEVRTFAEFPEDGSADFRLNVHNIWPDGRESTASFEANYRDGRLWFDGILVGSLWEIDDFTVYLRFGYRDDPAIEVCEMFQITQDGRHRARTWHWFRDQKLFQITLTEERRPD
jgi:hypothetical protein